MSSVSRFHALIRSDLQSLRLRFRIVSLFVALLPREMFGWARPVFYRLAGLRIGRRARFLGRLEVTGEGNAPGRITIGDDCLFTTPLLLNASAPIAIGHHVTVGHHVLLITDGHDYTDPLHRCGATIPRGIVIEDGVWVSANATILPGITLGRGCVVAAGAVVTRDVPPHHLVAGVPAHVVKTLPPFDFDADETRMMDDVQPSIA